MSCNIQDHLCKILRRRTIVRFMPWFQLLIQEINIVSSLIAPAYPQCTRLIRRGNRFVVQLSTVYLYEIITCKVLQYQLHKWNHSLFFCLEIRIPVGYPGRRGSPQRSRFFCFDIKIFKKQSFQPSTSPNGKSWIRRGILYHTVWVQWLSVAWIGRIGTIPLDKLYCII